MMHDPFLSVSLRNGHPSGSMAQDWQEIDGGAIAEYAGATRRQTRF